MNTVKSLGKRGKKHAQKHAQNMRASYKFTWRNQKYVSHADLY